tara:strand:- start:117 stop:392 length:276 start_codon:yes stop_codon:yes gene_type:complete
MNKQVINKTDVISFWQSPPSSGKCCGSWNLIYKDNGNKTKIISIRKKNFHSHSQKKIKNTWNSSKCHQSMASSMIKTKNQYIRGKFEADWL